MTHRLPIPCLCATLLAAVGCTSAPDPEPSATSVGPGIGTTLGAESSSGGGSSSGEATQAGSSSSTGADAIDDGSTSGHTLKLDVGGASTGDGCADDDLCCVLPGELPPHALLDAFIEAYPAGAMPQNLAQMQSFVPSIDLAQMAWSALNTGDELVDPENGGLVEGNLLSGRNLARNAALGAIPVDATTLDERQDDPVIADLGGPPGCVGVGWAWGSILFTQLDGAIDEVVYLYVGYCSADGDSEGFFYSDEATQICAPPA